MDGTCTSGVTEGEQWLPHLGKHPHQQGDQWGQRTSPGDRQHGMTPTKVVHAPARVPQPETSVHQCRSELDAGPCGWEHKPGRGPPLALRSRPKGMDVRSSTSGNACGRSLDHHGSQVPLLSDVQRPGLPRKLLSSGTGSCLHGPWGGLPVELARVPLTSPTPTPVWVSHLPCSPLRGLCIPTVPKSHPTCVPTRPSRSLGLFLPYGW